MNRPVVAHRIGGAKDRVSIDERLCGTFQCRHIKIAGDPPGVGDGVRRAGRGQVVQEPQGPLAVGQGMCFCRCLGLLHEQAPLAGCTAWRIERARWFWQRVLNLPCSSNLGAADVARVAAAIRAARETA